MKNKKIIIGVVIAVVALLIVVIALLLSNKYYTISFNTDGGSIVNSIKVKSGKELVLPSNPTKEGYNFSGWTNKENEPIKNGYIITSNLELFAIWSEDIKTFTIHFDTKGGSKIDDMVLTFGEELKLPANPTKDGYVFDGWEDANSMPILDGAKLSAEDITLYAKWKARYTVHFDTKGGSSISSIKLTEGDKITLPSNPTKTDNKFVKWTDKSGNQVKNGDVLKAVDTTLYAVWEEIKYTYTCPSDYKLEGQNCVKNESAKAVMTCPSGTTEKDGKCYNVSFSSRVEPTVTCDSKNVHVGGGSTPIMEGTLITIPGAYSYCVYGVVTDSYEQENSTNCTTRGHVWVNNKCYYEKGTPSQYKKYTCQSGYEYVDTPSTFGANGLNPGCFPATKKTATCPDSSYSTYTDPYVGVMCKKTTTIAATKKEA